MKRAQNFSYSDQLARRIKGEINYRPVESGVKSKMNELDKSARIRIVTIVSLVALGYIYLV